ncbi:hypothetical protein EDD85DRAFT_923122 [Armillaria nabsnona]|nr:hypothetical protein EDD85DRAFT_923122 [Armillaria nabsnona]
MRQGVIPCAPYSPELLISVQTMELSLQAFLCILCNLNSIAYEPYMHQQFTICYNLYVAILKKVEHHINQVLCHDAADYRLRNAYVACTLSLRDEPGTPIHPHYCMDGNNSLKRLQSSQEKMDNHDGCGNYFLSQDEVNAWSKEAIGNTIVTDAKDTEGNPCADQWENMKNDINSSMWGVFDETGVFVSLCRHGFLLLATDMVQSGELHCLLLIGKLGLTYPLAITDKIIKGLGQDLTCGYDIGCKFGTTIAKSPLGVLATEQNHTTVVDAFHEHAHCRICQICKLPLYTDGQGLTDHEESKHYFSESNALASSTHYASRFHHMQAIVQWMKRKDHVDTCLRLSKFLSTILVLQDTKIKLNISSSKCFPQWLAEELAYLKNWKQDPPEKTLEMEYYSQLVAYYHIDKQDNTAQIEMARRQLLKRQDKAFHCVQDMECVMNITTCWTVGSEKWAEAEKLVTTKVYQQYLDHLEGALVSRLFELTKMNRSGTGYKACRHIRKALKAQEDICEKPWVNSAVREASDAYYWIIRAQEEVHWLNIEICQFVTKIKAKEKYLR